MITKEKPKKEVSKRIDVVSLKIIKEGSIQYLPRKFSNPEDVVALCRQFLENLPQEKMICIQLDTKNQYNSIVTVSKGLLNASLVHCREVFKTAIASNANSIIIAHNHPSGFTEPSKEDISITNRIKKAGEIIGIPLLDHVIIGDNGKYLSFKEEDLL